MSKKLRNGGEEYVKVGGSVQPKRTTGPDCPLVESESETLDL